ncbi:hypothetical protein GCM10009133_17800 [Cocleimonas flava]|uniref:Phosphatidylglycerol lysyltransferase n=1 Tax=Cocleimonas flava TaxID=634765 RepID=A0A4R1ESX4_9GAMM|nr:DUF2156 domain-containing protein [Cocleimonas flava]TCJ84706.1 phosphatidylglycerol lysyltransferase [Cocleimonas flava]
MSPSENRLIPYLEKYGSHCMAYTSLEPCMKYFVMEDIGYIAYIDFKHWFWSRKERKIVLSNPVCHPDNYRKMLDAFLYKFSDVIFVQASRSFAEVLDEAGYQTNIFGIETEIPISDFSLAGKQRAKLRQWQNKCKREGVSVFEKNISDMSDTEEQQAISQISESWLNNKGGSEYSFLVRPLRTETEKDVRYFWAYQNDKLIAFATFDPIYRDGKVVAYYHNIDRIADNVPHGTSATIILAAIEVFKDEGVEVVNLGMSPLFLQRGLSQELNYNKLTRKAFWYAFEKLNYIYPFQGNASHKKKFNGKANPVYISGTNGTGLREVFAMVKANGMI